MRRKGRYQIVVSIYEQIPKLQSWQAGHAGFYLD